jgi:hypothetical protein
VAESKEKIHAKMVAPLPWKDSKDLLKYVQTCSLERLLAEVSNRGWRVLNMFELGDEKKNWRCNLQIWEPGAEFRAMPGEFAENPILLVAIASAMENMRSRLLGVKLLRATAPDTKKNIAELTDDL